MADDSAASLRYNNSMKSQKGFTILELLAVISIISFILNSTFAVVTIARVKARDVERVAEFKVLQKALRMYYNDKGHFPCDGWERSDNIDFLPELIPDYISKKIEDPINIYPNIYQYASYKKGPGGPCGQVMELNFDVEEDSDFCSAAGGYLINEMTEGPFHGSDYHCHIFFPELVTDACEHLGGGLFTPQEIIAIPGFCYVWDGLIQVRLRDPI